MIRPLLALLAVLVVACDSPLSPHEVLTLLEAEAHWGERPFQDYSVEIRQDCFCGPPVSEWARVTVVGGSVDRVVVVATGAEVSATERGYFRTVEGVFQAIKTVADDDWVKDVVVAFDADLGFPTRVDFVPKPYPDAGVTYYLRNVEPIP